MSIMYDLEVTEYAHTPYAICWTCGMKKPTGMMSPFITLSVLDRTSRCCDNPDYFWEREK